MPKNYFLPKQNKDDIIPSNLKNLSLNIKGKYDDDLWIDDNNKKWIKAFHGTGRHCKTDGQIKEMIDSILLCGFKNGKNNKHSNCDDKYHSGKKLEMEFMFLLI